jgi:hypothetical protein
VKAVLRSKVFFFEKKQQKTSTPAVRASHNARARVQKFFGSFFQKRTAFFSSPNRAAPGGREA